MPSSLSPHSSAAAEAPRPSRQPDDGPPPTAPSAFRAYLGFGLLGWGLAVLLGAAPHEDPVAGAALAAFGLALAWTAPRMPAVTGVPAWLVGAAGVVLVVGVAAASAWRGWHGDAQRIVLIAVGLFLAGSAPLVSARRTTRWRGQRVPWATWAAMAVACVAAPLLVWGVQAAFKGVAGTTPVEAFVEYGLVLPMAGFAAMLGWSPAVHGQTLTYMTATGPLSVEVGAACSGLQAMALFGGVLAVYLLVERPGGRAVAAWSALGLAGVYLANLARLFVLAVVGHAWGRDALLRVHADAGWVFFVAWALLFAWLARRHSARRRQVQPASA